MHLIRRQSGTGLAGASAPLLIDALLASAAATLPGEGLIHASWPASHPLDFPDAPFVPLNKRCGTKAQTEGKTLDARMKKILTRTTQE
jgi:hypothetical protein